MKCADGCADAAPTRCADALDLTAQTGCDTHSPFQGDVCAPPKGWREKHMSADEILERVNEQREDLDRRLAECRTRKERSAINKELWRLDQIADGLRNIMTARTAARRWRDRKRDG